ncbi:UDP-N-acetylmuramoyl-tripeptide--D-alanyl-D-alanine ligase [Sinomonas cellulolyticus]|uniref:UDP-N-acetylmuramoyl-tripeptide--D-alanyl-D-alanine ligase n=1 Tax=Sinomonas cellulolyticus TaxID=2801916 RepID=A0ABS1K1V4_9MICC|nr:MULTISPECIES: UDP-N-acetylmuramoyl-tripeptide--D-alanyl-D-alanine ligase [Sinomonas]MBL0705505.1 UDP-N-acetylmuramoyl-tripeptide--D-alanyl-D-alanine ligase [Sinomonas cellulolyticus]GHG41534.1 UDP-N-acetylmuramoyl-tripeptide--D-alanyl-D-alanine ligase [Sinomonas sp. KCTC 49339]
MIEFTAAQIAEITGGRLVAPPDIIPTSVVTDSREAVPGSLYVAKPGEHADGHAYVGAAVAAGAVLTLCEREVTDDGGASHPCVVVPDAVLAMGTLAKAAVERIRAERSARGEELTVVGITGSAGKTTTKDLVAGIFRSTPEGSATPASTVAPQGSYNGEVGVPLTVFRADTSTRYLVIEMGATGIGHIQYLADMVRPDIGVVLVVGSAHAGEFGGVENIAKAKGELVEALSAEGTAVLNADDPRVRAMEPRTKARLVFFTSHPEANADLAERGTLVAAHGASVDDGGSPVFDLTIGAQGPVHVASRLIGAHHTSNLLAAASAASAAGVPLEVIGESLSAQGPGSRWRMQRTERADGVTVINDAYNANPESMRAALRTLADLGRGRRTWAVLGAMLELGEESIPAHTAVGTLVVRLNIDRLVVVGREARALYVSAVNEGSWGSETTFVEDADAAFELLERELAPGDLVLVKSSNGVGLGALGDRIALPAADGATPHQGRSLT